jgi:hypothetical protein
VSIPDAVVAELDRKAMMTMEMHRRLRKHGAGHVHAWLLTMQFLAAMVNLDAVMGLAGSMHDAAQLVDGLRLGSDPAIYPGKRG